MSLFVHKETEQLHPRTVELMEEVAKRVEQDGIQAWWDLDAADILGAEAADYVKVPDTLDVWFDSGSTHASVVDVRPEFGPQRRHVSGRLRPTPRLVHVIADDLHRDERQGAL